MLVGIVLAGCSSETTLKGRKSPPDDKKLTSKDTKPDEEKTPKEQIKIFAEQFLDSVKAKEWDKAAGLVDDPWCEIKDGTFGIVTGVEGASKSLKEWRELNDSRMESLEVREVLPYVQARYQVQQRVKDPLVAQFMEGFHRVRPIDWVAFLVVKDKKDEPKVVGVLFFRSRDSKSRVAGLSD